MSRSATILTEKLGDTLASSLAEAEASVTMIAPFISRPAFDKLIGVIRPCVPVEVITRWLPSEVARGVSDPSILEFEGDREQFTVRLLNALHAKIYIVDERVAFVGSANLTNAGLGLDQPCNIEVLAELDPVPTMLLALARRLRREAVLATQEMRDAVEKAASQQRKVLSDIVVEGEAFQHEQLSECRKELWVPLCRFPNRLYAAYQSLENLPEATRFAALEDLSWIPCPDNLTESAFNVFVRNWLLGRPVVQELNDLICQPRRFGEVSAWLKRRTPESCPDMKSAKRRLQTLFRWLLYFAGDKYRLTKRKYTEVLSLIQFPFKS
jgi:hypothetical protein